MGSRGAKGYEPMTDVPGGCATSSRTRFLCRRSPWCGRTRLETDGQDAVPHARRPPRRGRAHALSRRPPLDLRLVTVGVPADLHVLRHRLDAIRPQPDRVGDPRPGAPLPAPRAVDHCVFMGMGEPMLNFDDVLAAARRLPDFGITHRRTTISTIGWLPGLRRFVDEVEEPIRLALSLHAADGRSARRSCRSTTATHSPTCSPSAVRYFAPPPQGLRRVRDARRRERPRRAGPRARGAARPAGLQGEPDPVQPDGDVRRLLAQGDRRVQAVLDRGRMPATVRLTRGRDIAAACGQLAATG